MKPSFQDGMKSNYQDGIKSNYQDGMKPNYQDGMKPNYQYGMKPNYLDRNSVYNLDIVDEVLNRITYLILTKLIQCQKKQLT